MEPLQPLLELAGFPRVLHPEALPVQSARSAAKPAPSRRVGAAEGRQTAMRERWAVWREMPALRQSG